MTQSTQELEFVATQENSQISSDPLYSEDMIKKMILTLVLLAWTAEAMAWDASPHCLYSLETQFFDATTVKQSFDLYHVFQSQWDPIYTDLAINVRRVPDLVKARSRKMLPSPIDHPFDPEGVKQVLLDVEFEVFRDTMIAHYFEDLNAIQGMFAYILKQQEEKINRCLGIKKKKDKSWSGGIQAP